MHLYLYATGTGGYGTASTSLLSNVAGKTTSDGTNFYTTTDSKGFFSLTGNYSCTSGSQVYLYGIGGNPGAGTNPAASMMAVVGQCPNSGTLAGTVSYIWMNEVTTVATAYALAAYATDPTHIATANTVQGLSGISSAAANAANLANLTNGQAITTTPFGNGTAPTAEINTLANILAACVNTTGAPSPACSTLFLAAQSTPSGGTQPTETASAAINIAHNPGTNTAVLYGVQPAASVPFQPSLPTPPNDFTVALKFTGGGLAAAPALAVDAAGNIWAGSNSVGALAEFSPLGNALSGALGYATAIPLHASTPCTVKSLSVQADGSILSNSTTTCLSTVSSTGVANVNRSSYFGVTSDSTGALDAANGYRVIDGDQQLLNYATANRSSANLYYISVGTGPYSVGFDGSQNLWVASFSGRLDEFAGNSQTSNVSTGITGGGLNAPTSVALDHSNNAWTSNSGNNSLSEFNPGRTAISGSSGFTGGGLNAPSAVVIDGLGRAWASNKGNDSISEFSTSGAAVSPSTGFTGVGAVSSPNTLVIDSSGNIWVGSTSTAVLTEFVGAAAPVVTPVVTAVTNNTLGTRP